MTCDLAPMHPTQQLLVADHVTGGDWIQAARPLLLQPCLAAMACGDLLRHELALPARPWVANIQAGMIPTSQHVAASLTAREHPVLLRQLSLHHHIPTQQRLRLLPTEASCRNENRTVSAQPSVADLLAAVPPAGEQTLAPLPTRDGRAPVRAPPHDSLLAARARPVRRKRLAGRARPGVALQDADVRAPGGGIVGGGALGGGVRLLEGLGAGLAAGVRGEEEVVGGLAAAPAEAGVSEVTGRDGLHGLAPGAAPGGGRVGRVGGGSRGARPLADAGKVEDGEAAAAGPHGRRPPHHVVADHTLHRPPRQLVLDLLHQLRHRPPRHLVLDLLHRPVLPCRRRGMRLLRSRRRGIRVR